jgi:two-component system response regulator MprA
MASARFSCLGYQVMKESNISPAGDPPGAALHSQTTPPLRILVVDDDPLIRRFDIEVLVRSGYEVDAAADGAAAWQALNADSYDLLVTDNDMPNVSGLELLKKLRAARMALPVIMATGTMPKEEFNRHPWLRPAATLLKPYTVEELLGIVTEVLRTADGALEHAAPPPNPQTRQRV